jgi:hypothetical protein
MSKGKHKPTDDAIEILRRRYVKDDPRMLYVRNVGAFFLQK